MLNKEYEINMDTAEVVEESNESMPFWKKVLIVGGIVAAGFAGCKAYQHFTGGDDDVDVIDAVPDMASEVVEA